MQHPDAPGAAFAIRCIVFFVCVCSHCLLHHVHCSLHLSDFFFSVVQSFFSLPNARSVSFVFVFPCCAFEHKVDFRFAVVCLFKLN